MKVSLDFGVDEGVAKSWLGAWYVSLLVAFLSSSIFFS